MPSFLFDCGNTCIKFALYNEASLKHHSFVEYDELEAFVARLFHAHPAPDEIRIASVTTNARLIRLKTLLKQYTSITPLIAQAQEFSLGVTNNYDYPQQLGSDRWLALIAAWDIYHTPCLVVDLGTALTIDYIDQGGNFVGGVILPGIKSMRDALMHNTTLTDIESLEYTEKLGKNTKVGVSSGIYYALLGSITSLYNTLDNPIVVLSGGRARWLTSVINKHAPHIVVKTNEDLVIEGLLRYQP